MDPVLLTIDQVAERCGCERSTIRRGWYDGVFPKPIRIGRRGIRWRVADVEQWISNRPTLRQPVKQPEGV